jgi:predicted transcriptional regulator
LKKNLLNQVEVSKKANQPKKSIKVILYFTEPEYEKVLRILKEIDATGDSDIVLVDARQDNKPSASKA